MYRLPFAKPMRALLAWVSSSVLLTGCFSFERVPPPEDLEGLLGFFVQNGATATDEELAVAVENTDAVLRALLTDGDAKVGGIAALTSTDLAAFGIDDGRDPSLAPGMFLASRFTCTPERLAEVISDPDQPTIHPNVYDSYDRVFDTDRAAWLRGDIATLDWHVTYEATPTATQYRAKTQSAVRRVLMAEDFPAATALVQRTFLTEPAEFVGAPENHVFDQDYQVEIFFDGGDGTILHLYGLWRYMQLGVVSVNDDVFVDFQLNGMLEWDTQTEAACAVASGSAP